MKRIQQFGREIDVPECLDELSPQQYKSYLLLAQLRGAGMLDQRQWRDRVTELIAASPVELLMLKDDVRFALIGQVGDIIDNFCDPSHPLGINLRTCRNLLPRDGGYCGPADWLNGFPFGKFTQCLALMGDDNGAEEMARVMYSIPADKPVPDPLPLSCQLLFDNCLRALQEAPIEINGQDIDFGILFRGDGSRRADDRTGWLGVTMEVAASGVFGPLKEVEATDMWAVLLYLYKCKFEYLHRKND